MTASADATATSMSGFTKALKESRHIVLLAVRFLQCPKSIKLSKTSIRREQDCRLALDWRRLEAPGACGDDTMP